MLFWKRCKSFLVDTAGEGVVVAKDGLRFVGIEDATGVVIGALGSGM